MNQYMAHVGPTGSVFIKVRDFFEAQGGFTEEWGKHWVPVEGESIEDVRRRACDILPGARPYSNQAGSHAAVNAVCEEILEREGRATSPEQAIERLNGIMQAEGRPPISVPKA